jgi:hypothetical protein
MKFQTQITINHSAGLRDEAFKKIKFTTFLLELEPHSNFHDLREKKKRNKKIKKREYETNRPYVCLHSESCECSYSG